MRKIVWPVAALCVLASVALAQPAANDQGELAAFTGGAFGLGSHWTVGGTAGLGLSKYAMVMFEGSYTPLGQDTLRSHPSPWPAQGSRLLDLNLSVHVTIPVRDRVIPYVILGGGTLWDAYDHAVTGPGGTVVTRVNEWNFGFHTGGGLRYYIRDNWGVRPELRVTVSNRTYTRLSMGVFYTLPAGWP
ncbi:MAG TPA: outer membrane beta-barrel protein [Candidatus Acidoferrales bacterium]|nr:outer membrane beta-barrel protein [Candidatus Acidoferrales bacterium]